MGQFLTKVPQISLFTECIQNLGPMAAEVMKFEDVVAAAVLLSDVMLGCCLIVSISFIVSRWSYKPLFLSSSSHLTALREGKENI